MGAFDRTAFGRDNRALFYDVDKTVYVEGGCSVKGASESFDGGFWRQIFATVRPDLKIKILHRGSKADLTCLAINFDRIGFDNNIIAMDRDYDGALGNLIDNNKIIYTYGYSYENDIFYGEVLPEIFHSLCPICDIENELIDKIDTLISEYCRAVWWGQYADICGYIIGTKVIDRDKIGKYVSTNNPALPPKIMKSALARDVYMANKNARVKRLSNVPLKIIDLPSLTVGHLYAHYCFHVLVHLHSIYSNTKKLTKDGVRSVAILRFSYYLINNKTDPISQYYNQVLSDC